MKQEISKDRSSVLKTMLPALTVGAAALALAAVLSTGSAGVPALIVGLLLLLLALPALALAASGAIVLHRLRRAELGATDLFLESNEGRREAALERPGGFRSGPLRRLAARAMLGHDFLVGDAVEIRSVEEIQATLDERGCLDGMPFQPEMVRFCGRQGQVFRSIDKIYDYGRTRLMRRLRGCVLVSGLRCDGADHAGCEARCYMIWKTEWLRRPGERPAAVGRGASTAPTRVTERAADGVVRERFLCQFTELHAASKPMGPREIGKELRPLMAGNVTLRTWIVGLATRYFNFVQQWRGGTGFPALPRVDKESSSLAAEPLVPGDKVVVRPIVEIASTLNDKGKHRGLWFDPDQIKHCGKPRTVLARVDRIIDDAHGQMLTMKTPCILLEGVDYSGEVLNFNAQQDLFFWREAWLEKKS